MKPEYLTVRVAAKTAEADDICTFELIHPENRPLPAFDPGSHIDVRIRDGLVRQYSLANDSAETHRYLIGVLREPASRGGSASMHDAIQTGDLLDISTPKNHFQLVLEARRSLLFAGGIGITPILCMAEHLSSTAADFEMHYCARSRSRTAFTKRIEGSPFADRVHFHFDDEPAQQKLDLAGVIDRPAAGTHIYVCGPKGFMDYVLGSARTAGWPESQLHYEFFSAAPQDSAADTSFQIKLSSSGKIVTIPADKTVVKALADAGIDIPTSCEQGVCGTCLTRVLEGKPDHRDAYLTPEEQEKNDQFLPCCSRALSAELVLDL